jgi:hypothetical protein
MPPRHPRLATHRRGWGRVFVVCVGEGIMTSYAGKIYTSPIKEHQINCGSCPETAVYHAVTQIEAAKEFRLHGWKQIAGQWTCPGCVYDHEVAELLKEQR